MSEHIETRQKLKDIESRSYFNNLLESATLSEDEMLFMRMHYIENKDFRYIGDTLGYSETTMKRWHKKILRKLQKLI